MNGIATDIVNLCVELAVFGIATGNISMEISYENISVHVYTQEDKRHIEKLLCPDYEWLVDVGKEDVLLVMK